MYITYITDIPNIQNKKKTYHDVKNLQTGNTKNQPRSTF